MKMHLFFFIALTLISCFCNAQPVALPKPLNGPWKFHTGDKPAWAMPGFDDTGWERADLTPKAGAHDGDVGLKGYVPGWAAKGHAGYWGYAWYRIHIPVGSLKTTDTVLLAPTLVDDAYQLYVNGRLMGSVGDFSGKIPSVYSTIPKRLFLPRTLLDTLQAKELVIAFRTWVSPASINGADDAGGIHIAPMLGSADAVNEVYHSQWMQTFWGYVVDAVEPLLFTMLALFIYYRRKRFDTAGLPGYLIAALIITALVRASQVFYYWGQWESQGLYLMSKMVIFIPLSIGLWVAAWHRWFGLKYSRNVTLASLALAGLYILSNFLSYVWDYQTVHADTAIFYTLATYIRLVFVIGMLWIMAAAFYKYRQAAVLPVLAMLLLCSGLFASELLEIGVPGIWFPFGVGVSRTQYVYALFDVFFLMAILIKTRRITYGRNDG